MQVLRAVTSNQGSWMFITDIWREDAMNEVLGMAGLLALLALFLVRTMRRPRPDVLEKRHAEVTR